MFLHWHKEEFHWFDLKIKVGGIWPMMEIKFGLRGSSCDDAVNLINPCR